MPLFRYLACSCVYYGIATIITEEIQSDFILVATNNLPDNFLDFLKTLLVQDTFEGAALNRCAEVFHRLEHLCPSLIVRNIVDHDYKHVSLPLKG